MDKWLEVTVETTDAELDDLAAKLTMNGAEGLVLEDEADFKQFLEQNRQYWDYVDDALLERMRGVARIKFYVPDTDPGSEEMAAALRGIGDIRAAAEEIKLRSRQYAKRQLSWFRRSRAAKWLLWGREPDFAAACRTSTEYLEEYGLV